MKSEPAAQPLVRVREEGFFTKDHYYLLQVPLKLLYVGGPTLGLFN